MVVQSKAYENEERITTIVLKSDLNYFTPKFGAVTFFEKWHQIKSAF